VPGTPCLVGFTPVVLDREALFNDQPKPVRQIRVDLPKLERFLFFLGKRWQDMVERATSGKSYVGGHISGFESGFCHMLCDLEPVGFRFLILSPIKQA